MTTTGRPPVLFVHWTTRSARASDIAAALGGEAALISPAMPRPLKHPVSTALRYLVSLGLTVVALARCRPAAVIATNPPLFPPLVALACSRLAGVPFLMDSHPSAFGAKGHRVLARLQPVHRWLGRRAAAVLVTTPERAAQVHGWGGHGVVLHEAPISFPPRRPEADGTDVVLFLGVFAEDEPVLEVVEAARTLPAVTFRITGELRLVPPGLRETSPPNVVYVGYLTGEQFKQQVADAATVLTLTTEPSSVMRSAYEAVYARTPLITTDTPALRETFPYAVHCRNTAQGIAAAITTSLERRQDLLAQAEAALALQQVRWDRQLEQLREACR